jgi:hypothetical protein
MGDDETEPQTAAGRRREIQALAERTFAAHRIEQVRPGTWSCIAVPATSIHAFWVHFEPYAVMMWGDLGECVLRVSTEDTLEWFTRMSDDSGAYFHGKISALGGPKDEFVLGDALRVLDEEREDARADARAELEHALRDLAPGDAPPTLQSFLDEDAERRLAHARDVLAVMRDVEHETTADQERAWMEAWGEVGVSYSDVHDCRGPTTTALWMWEARRAFARLYRRHAFDAWLDGFTDGWGRVGRVIGLDSQHGIDPAVRAKILNGDA